VREVAAGIMRTHLNKWHSDKKRPEEEIPEHLREDPWKRGWRMGYQAAKDEMRRIL